MTFSFSAVIGGGDVFDTWVWVVVLFSRFLSFFLSSSSSFQLILMKWKKWEKKKSNKWDLVKLSNLRAKWLLIDSCHIFSDQVFDILTRLVYPLSFFNSMPMSLTQSSYIRLLTFLLVQIPENAREEEKEPSAVSISVHLITLPTKLAIDVHGWKT